MSQIDMKKYRPLPFYFMNARDLDTQYSVSNIDRKMKELADDGFGGCILFNSWMHGFSADDFLAEPYFLVVERFVHAAEKYGLKLWLMDGWRCPSGDVGGKIAAVDPTLNQRRIARNEAGEVTVCDVPWGFPAFEEPESSELFIELVYEKYKKYLGKYFGNVIEGIFSDADNRRYDAFAKDMMGGKAYYPWAKDFEKRFAAEYHYDITPFLGDIVDGKSSKESFDYWCFCEKLYLQWFKNNYEWCKANNLEYSFHTSDTGPFPRSRCIRSSIFTEGNPFNVYKYCSFPGTDHELLMLDGGTHFDSRIRRLKASRGGDDKFYNNPNFFCSKYDLRAKYAASAAYWHGKKGAASELYAVANWGATASGLRLITAWQLFQGIVFFIPHGIEHRDTCFTKYIAPPEQHIGSAGCIRELCDFIAKYTFIASQGEFAPSVMVEDITEAVRGGKEDVENFFTFTDMLNHAGISYVIVPENTPGAIKVGDTLPELPPREFTFSGKGDLIAMRRKLDGKNFLMVCNLWSTEEVSGTLEFEGRKVDLVLASGEVAVIGGPFEEFRTPEKFETVKLPFPAGVKFAAPNRVPFHYNSEFTVAEESDSQLYLLVPEIFAAEGISYDGKALDGGIRTTEYGDNYIKYAVDGTRGKHSFALTAWKVRPDYLGLPFVGTGNEKDTNNDKQFYLPVILEGEFDTALDIEGEFDHMVAGTYYILDLYAPAKCDVSISKRRTALDVGSWADQGQPFYSGTAEYRFDISGISGRVKLSAPHAAAKIEAVVDGKSCGATGFEPFVIDLGDVTEAGELVVRVTNTKANEWEEFKAPSGLIQGAELLLVK